VGTLRSYNQWSQHHLPKIKARRTLETGLLNIIAAAGAEREETEIVAGGTNNLHNAENVVSAHRSGLTVKNRTRGAMHASQKSRSY
jgi:hypothetical protein